jgi:hypothetical protein
MLKRLNYPLLFLAILLVRSAIVGAGIGDAIALTAAAALYAYSLYLETKREQPVNDQIRKDVETLKHSVDSLKMAKNFSRAQ